MSPPWAPYPSHQNGAPLGGPAGGFGLAACGPFGEPSLRGPRGPGHRRPLCPENLGCGGDCGPPPWPPCSCWGNRAGALPGSGRQRLLAGWCLWHTDGHAFYRPREARLPRHRFSGRPSLGRYLVRYLLSHKNYLVNTGILWGMAWVPPLFFRQVAGVWMAPLGFALLSFNTPMGILLSCDPSSQQAIRFLPGQRRTFCLPYSLFLCACYLVAEGFFLGSWRLQIGGVSGPMLVAAVFFALESAILTVRAGMVLSHPELENGE